MRQLRAPIFCLAFAVLLPGCVASPPAAAFVEQATRMHAEALGSTVINDPDLQDYFQELGSRIAKAALAVEAGKVNPEFISRVHCELVACDTVNAYCTGGTHVYLYNGLFHLCESEGELAFAIAHAYAHLINRDLEATKMQPDPNIPSSMAAWGFVANRFSRTQEQDADAMAIAILARAGWNAGQCTQLFERAESLSGGNVAGDRQSLPGRIGALQALAADVRQTARVLPVADPKTFAMLRQRAAQFQEPPGPPVAVIFLRAFPNCILSGDAPEQREAQQRLRPRLPEPVQAVEPN